MGSWEGAIPRYQQARVPVRAPASCSSRPSSCARLIAFTRSSTSFGCEITAGASPSFSNAHRMVSLAIASRMAGNRAIRPGRSKRSWKCSMARPLAKTIQSAPSPTSVRGPAGQVVGLRHDGIAGHDIHHRPECPKCFRNLLVGGITAQHQESLPLHAAALRDGLQDERRLVVGGHGRGLQMPFAEPLAGPRAIGAQPG